MKTSKPKGYVPLYRALSKLGVASRTEATKLILNGVVHCNGQVIKNPKHLIIPEKADIKINGQKIHRNHIQLIVLYKPKGFITTKRDEKSRKTIYDLLPKELHTLHPVGRLDAATTGLLLLTNSTKISHFLTAPENMVVKKYLAQIRGALSKETQQRLKNPIDINSETYHLHDYTILKESQKESLVLVTLTEGKNREIRNLFNHFGNEVIKLKRIEIAGITLKNLEPGNFYKMNLSEIYSVLKKIDYPNLDALKLK